MLVPCPARTGCCGSFPASPGCRGPSAAGARSLRRPPTRCSTARRRGRTSTRTRSSRSRSSASMPRGSRRHGSRASSGRRARSRRRRRPCTGSTTPRSLAAPRFADSPGELLALLDGAVFVAHNADFDLPMLEHAFARAGLDYRPVARRVHARRVSAARADRAKPPARVDLRAARRRARRCARRPRRRARDGGAAAAPARRGHRARDRGARPRRIHAPPRPRGDTRPASEPQIRRVFGMARSAGLVGPDGRSTVTRSSRLVERVTGVSDVDSLTREQVQDVYDELELLIAARPQLHTRRARRPARCAPRHDAAVRIEIVEGDITQQAVDAIVNAANSTLLGGGGVDGAIHRRGGPAILEECRALRASRYPAGLPAGEAVATTAGRPPRAMGDPHRRAASMPARLDLSEVLRSCYTRSLAVADELGASSVAFPLISSGAFGWPLEDAVRQALTRAARGRDVCRGGAARAVRGRDVPPRRAGSRGGVGRVRRRRRLKADTTSRRSDARCRHAMRTLSRASRPSPRS